MPRVRFPDGAFSYAALLVYCPGLLDELFGVSRAWYAVSDRLCGNSFDTGEACTWCMGDRFLKPTLVPTAIVDATMDVGIGGQQLLDSDGACCAWYRR
ncbi:hypothetical protein PI124_g21370 [Phytophthora idaei]|nr:hypothetical protein PI126_g21115 [Phytophthora idaei]KAG3233556.1 hypothetical protein PI124_g21370 [Phytophthora idaei]